jgi:hypothetical protein
MDEQPSALSDEQVIDQHEQPTDASITMEMARIIFSNWFWYFAIDRK